MAVTYRASLRTTRMNDVVADIDSGAGAATVEIGTAGFATVIAIFTLSDPASSVAGDGLTCLGMPESTGGGWLLKPGSRHSAGQSFSRGSRSGRSGRT